MAQKTLNLEIGDRLTKACMCIPKGKAYQIERSFMFQTPDSAVQDGQLIAPDIMAAELRSQLDSRGIKDAKNVVFTLTSGKVASREVTLPPMKDNRIKGVIEMNATDYFPVDMSKYHLTYSLLERKTGGDNPGCRVLVYAAPLSLLEGYFLLAEQAGLIITAIDFSGNSQYQALKSLSEGGGVTMFVNVDCTSSYASFAADGKLVMQRAFNCGGDELVLGYMNAAGMKAEQYLEALEYCCRSPEDFAQSGVMTEEEAAEARSRLVGNILRSSDYYNSNHWDLQVERIVLMGPCGRLTGLREHVSSAAGVEALWLDGLPGVSSLANETDAASTYISCIGSAVAPLDFIPPQLRVDKKKLRKAGGEASMTPGIIVCVICVLAAAALGVFSILNYSSLSEEKANLEKQISQLEFARDAYETYLLYQAAEGSMLSLSGAIDSPNDRLADFVEELERSMPSEILLLSAVCTREGVSMNVTVPSYAEVAVTLVQLRAFSSVSGVSVSSISESLDESGFTYCSFSVTCTYAVLGGEAAE